MSDNISVEAIRKDFGKTPAASLRGSGGLLWFLLCVVVAGAVGFVVWQQQQTIDAMHADYQTLSSAAATINNLQQEQQQVLKAQQAQDQQVLQLGQTQQQTQTGVQQQLQLALNAVNDQAAQIKRLTDEVTVLRSKVADVGAAALRSQILAETTGLLRLAEQRLQVAQDLDAAIALVNNSDLLLARLSDAPAAMVRRQLASDLAALQAAQQNDPRKLYQQLGEAIAQLPPLLPVSKTAVNDTRLKPVPDTGVAQAGWFDRLLGFFSQYFVFTHRDGPVTPMLTPQQGWLIQKNIELQLQQARLAALNGDAVLYKASLKEAQAAIEDALQGEGKAALLKQLKTLEAATLRGNLPSLAATLAAVQQLQSPAGKTGTAP